MTYSPTREPVQRDYTPAWDYNLNQSIRTFRRSAADPCAVFDGSAWWFSYRINQEPVTLRLREKSSTVSAQAWGPGAQAALESLPQLLGADDDWSEFDSASFQRKLPNAVRDARRIHSGLRLGSSGRVVDHLIPVILEQKVTGAEAFAGYSRLLRSYGHMPPGPSEALPARLRLAPTPAHWRTIPSWQWHRAGVGPARAETIMRVLARAPALERLSEASSTRAQEGLQSILGIGPWSSAEVVQVSHGDPDAISVGDYHLAHFVGYALTGKRTDDAGMLELLAPFAGHRQRVVRLLYLSGIREPRRAPRLGPTDYRRI